MPPSDEAITVTFCVPRSTTIQLHAQYFPGPVADFVNGLCNLDPAALAAAARVDLGFHHPDLAAEFFGCLDGLVDTEAGNAARRGHPVLPEDFLCLVFVDFHLSPLP